MRMPPFLLRDSRHAAILAGALVLVLAPLASAQGYYKDVPANHWAAPAVNALSDQGILLGNPDGTFDGNQPVTRYEMAVMLYRVLQDAQQGQASGAPSAPAPSSSQATALPTDTTPMPPISFTDAKPLPSSSPTIDAGTIKSAVLKMDLSQNPTVQNIYKQLGELQANNKDLYNLLTNMVNTRTLEVTALEKRVTKLENAVADIQSAIKNGSLRGPRGPMGPQGLPGPKGDPGQALYLNKVSTLYLISELYSRPDRAKYQPLIDMLQKGVQNSPSSTTSGAHARKVSP